ncbi:MAG TPA: hypothetical protein VK436_11045 [Methanocella sp.]|nr:hypothetical protein [Methanocella sp.]
MSAVLALLFKNKLLAGMAIPLLLWLGGGGLFNFDAGLLTTMQLSHMLMVVVSMYLAYSGWFVADGDKKSFLAGIGLGIVVAVALLSGMIWYYSIHPEVYRILLDVGWKGPEFR